jgi:hypothetical protein
MRSTKCEVSRVRRVAVADPACYVARLRHSDVNAARSLRTHLPNRRATLGRCWSRVSAGQECLLHPAGACARAARPASLAVGATS